MRFFQRDYCCVFVLGGFYPCIGVPLCREPSECATVCRLRICQLCSEKGMQSGDSRAVYGQGGIGQGKAAWLPASWIMKHFLSYTHAESKLCCTRMVYHQVYRFLPPPFPDLRIIFLPLASNVFWSIQSAHELLVLLPVATHGWLTNGPSGLPNQDAM